MMRCAFLTTDDLTAYTTDDELALAELVSRGWKVTEVSWWRAKVDWGEFDVVVIRSTWDYQHHLDSFLDVLGSICAVGTRLLNPLPLVRWNVRKTYLCDLADRGVTITPTAWLDRVTAKGIAATFDRFDTDEVVVKPVVSASAGNTFRILRGHSAAMAKDMVHAFAGREAMVQPFVRSIVDEGEYSLFFFGGEYSHAIRKTPKAGDFRVQEEHGATIRSFAPDSAMVRSSAEIIEGVGSVPLYARVDLVRYRDELVLMELELVEPSLYFRMDREAPGRFASALERSVGDARPGD